MTKSHFPRTGRKNSFTRSPRSDDLDPVLIKTTVSEAGNNADRVP